MVIVQPFLAPAYTLCIPPVTPPVTKPKIHRGFRLLTGDDISHPPAVVVDAPKTSGD